MDQASLYLWVKTFHLVFVIAWMATVFYLPRILVNLAEGTELLPDERDARAEVHRWMFFEQSSVLPTIAMLRFRLLTGRLDADSGAAGRARRTASAVAMTADGRLREREFFAADRFTVADVALFGYLHVVHETGIDAGGLEGLNAWMERVRSQPGHVEDLAPYPDNARPGRSRSIWDAGA